MRKNPVKFLPCITVLLAVILLLSACTEAQKPDTGETPDTGEISVPITTEPSDTESPAAAKLVIVADGKAKLSIVRAEDASKAITGDATELNKKLTRYTSATFRLTTDWVKRGDEVDNSGFEILVGNTNRQATRDLLDSLPADSYGIRVTENKVVIAGTDDTMTAYALYDFESKYLRSGDYTDDKSFALPVGTEHIVTDSTLTTQKSILNSNRTVIAVTENDRNLSPQNGFNAAQGAATDGTYFYNILKKKVDDVETDIIVKKNMSDWATVAVSEEMPLDHANDMCYNSKEGVLVITNMVGQKISYVDPETLTLIRTIDATTLPGVPYAIAYNATNDRYAVASGGKINITDASFNVISSIALQTLPYVGQGMDADDDFIFMPRSPDSSQGTKDNVIVVYTWSGLKRVIHLDLSIETETLLNYGGKYYVNFNVGGARISDLHYVVVYQ